MKSKLIRISDQENKCIQDEANEREITFSDMLRRIIDDRYENKIKENMGYQKIAPIEFPLKKSETNILNFCLLDSTAGGI
jgi:hypothetical protein